MEIETNNTKYYDCKGAICRTDFLVISILLFIAHLYILFVFKQNAVTKLWFVTVLSYMSLAFICYARFCAFAKRILDITGEKPNNGFHTLSAIFMSLSSLALNNRIMLIIWLSIFIFCTLMPGIYSKEN